MKKPSSQKTITPRLKAILASIGFFILGAFLVVYTGLTYKTSLTVLAHNHFSHYVLSSTPRKLLRNNTVSGEFTAYEDHLGAVGLRLQNRNGNHVRREDTIRFRIREKGTNRWYYSRIYYGGQFHELDIFPFGFPAIEHSKGKLFDFEITSLAGSPTNGLSIINTKPVIVTQYQFTAHDLKKNIQTLLVFVIEKLLYCLSNPEFYIYMLLFFSPFILSVLALTSRGQKMILPITTRANNLKQAFFHSPIGKRLNTDLGRFNVLDYGICLFFLVDTLFIKSSSVLLSTLFLVLWFVRVMYRKYDTIFFLLPGIVFVIFCLIFSQMGADSRAEKAAVWSIQFLFFGSLLMLFAYLWTDFFPIAKKVKK